MPPSPPLCSPLGACRLAAPRTVRLPRLPASGPGPGGGSGEVVVTWDPLPAAVGVAHFRVYENRLPGQFWLLAS